jgi:hypothetical protein
VYPQLIFGKSCQFFFNWEKKRKKEKGKNNREKEGSDNPNLMNISEFQQ